MKTFTLEECRKHCSEDDCWLIMHGKVYDITSFLDEHPGGFDIIITNTGKDATEEFEEIGHSRAAVEMLDKYLIGELEGGARITAAPKAPLQTGQAKSSPAAALLKALLPLLVIAVAVFYALAYNKQ